MRTPRHAGKLSAPHRPTTRGRADKSGRPPRIPFAILVTGLIVGGLVLLLVLNTFSAANELRRHDLASRDASVAVQLEELQNEVADSAAPANLAAAALALGMVPAGNPAFLVIGSDGAVQVMGSAAPATAAIVDLPHPSTAPKTSDHPAKGDKKKNSNKDNKKKSTKSTKKGAKKPSKHTSTQSKHGTGDKKHHGTAGTKTKSDHPPAPPSPTPTPTVTLPGGDR
jgi:hypothetical protein